MPNPKTQRAIVLQSSFNATNVSTMNLSMDASFTTSGGTTNKFEDVSNDNTEEKSKYRMKFSNVAGGEIGALTLRLVGKGDLGAGVTIAKTDVRTDIDPAPTNTSVSLIERPAASFERIWKQAVTDASGAEFVDDIAKLDMRVTAGSGITVVQTATTQGDNQLVISYSWKNAAGATLVSGTVTLDSSVTAGTGYSLGSIRVTDNDPTTGEERRR